MAIVRQVGTTIEKPLKCDKDKLEEEKTIIGIRVLDFDEWRRFVRLLDNVSHAEDALEGVRKVLGMGVEYVKNLRVMNSNGDLEEFKLSKMRSELTKESMSVLMPFKDEILEMIRDAAKVKEGDLKN